VSEKLAAAICDCDLDAALRVDAERRVGATQDAPEDDVKRLAGRDLTLAQIGAILVRIFRRR
jgi:hypothetical protein